MFEERFQKRLHQSCNKNLVAILKEVWARAAPKKQPCSKKWDWGDAKLSLAKHFLRRDYRKPVLLLFVDNGAAHIKEYVYIRNFDDS